LYKISKPFLNSFYSITQRIFDEIVAFPEKTITPKLQRNFDEVWILYNLYCFSRSIAQSIFD